MIIIFDKNKDAINQQKHGVSMALAASIDWSLLLSAEDIRHNYGEAGLSVTRQSALGFIVLFLLTGSMSAVLSACARRTAER